MLKNLYYFGMALISIILFIFAPTDYNANYSTIVSMLAFFLAGIFILDRYRIEGLGFNYFFIIGLILTNFIYAYFYFPTNPSIESYGYGFNRAVICKSLSVSFVALSFYIAGFKFRNNDVRKYSEKQVIEINKNLIKLLIVITFLLFAIYYFSGGYENMKSVYSEDNAISTAGGIWGYSQYLMFLTTTMLAIFLFHIKSTIIKTFALLTVIIISTLMLLTGMRLLPIGIALILLTGFSRYVKKIPFALTLIITLLGTFFLYFIMLFRKDVSISASDIYTNVSNPLDIFIDLIGVNRNLYLLVDYVDTNGHLFFLNELPSLVSAIPSGGKLLNMFGFPENISSGFLPTYLTFGNNAPYGMGTSMVGEAYLSFGIIGVLLVFFLFGISVKKFLTSSSTSVYGLMGYFYLISQSLFYSRIDYLWALKAIVWISVIYYILKQLTVHKGAKF